MDFVIRAAVPEEAAEIVGLWDVAAAPGRAIQDTADGVRALLARDPDALQVAVSQPGGDIVGALISGFDGWRGAFYRLAVVPTWRRHHVGFELVAAGERRLRTLGCVRAAAIVLEENDGGIGFWKAAGYERDDVDRRWVKNLYG